jgi:hypothetical protein
MLSSCLYLIPDTSKVAPSEDMWCPFPVSKSLHTYKKEKRKRRKKKKKTQPAPFTLPSQQSKPYIPALLLACSARIHDSHHDWISHNLNNQPNKKKPQPTQHKLHFLPLEHYQEEQDDAFRPQPSRR